MDFLREHQLDIMLALVAVSGLLAIFSFISNSVSIRRKYALFAMSLGAMLLLIADRHAYFFRGNTSQVGYVMTRLSNFTVFLMTIAVIYFFNVYLVDYFEKEIKILPKNLKISEYLCYVATFLLIISQFTGLYYTFDENNLYQRSNGFIICYIFPLLVLFIQLSIIVKYNKSFKKHLQWGLLFFTIIPIIASIFQIFMYGISLTNMTIVGLVILLRIVAVIDNNDIIADAHRKEVELLKEKQEATMTMLVQTSEALASAIDAKDEYTNGHSKRVSEYSEMIAKKTGKSAEECQEIRLIALMHDVGKIGIPGAVLRKDSNLTDEEYAQIKGHTIIGNEILSNIREFPELSIGAHYHHERYDGRGYPEGLKGEEIPEIARIIAVADSYDAMASKRSYRDVMPQPAVREQIVKGIGSQFDPKFAQIMINLIDEDKDYQMRQM